MLNELSMERPAASDLKTPFQRFATRACFSIVIGVSLLVLGEAACYLYFRFDPGPPIYKNPYFSRTYARELNESAKRQYLPYVVWRRAPYQGRYITVDDQGVRKTQNSYCDDNKNEVIWMFGDSALWGTGSNDAETIPSQLAKLYAQSGKKICITNYGEAGWVSTQEVIELMLQLKQAPRPPNFVVFYDGTDDVFLRHQTDVPNAHQNFALYKEHFEEWQPRKRWGVGYLRMTNTYRALEELSQKLNVSKPSTKPQPSQQEIDSLAYSVEENYLNNMRLVEALAASYGFQDLFFWYPTSLAGQKPLTGAEAAEQQWLQEENPGLAMLTRETYRLCRSLKLPDFFYLGDILDDRKDRLYIDTSHLTPEGNGLIAQHLFQVLQTAKAANSQ